MKSSHKKYNRWSYHRRNTTDTVIAEDIQQMELSLKKSRKPRSRHRKRTRTGGNTGGRARSEIDDDDNHRTHVARRAATPSPDGYPQNMVYV